MNRDTPWSEIIAAISRFQRSFANDILGAGESEIARLEDVVGHALLPEYREFLKWMGHGLGGLKIATSDFDVETIYKVYHGPELRPPSGLLFIGKQLNDETAYDVCLSHKEGKEGRVIRVVFGVAKKSDGTQQLVIPQQPEPYEDALSLQAIIFDYAFYQFRLRQNGGPNIFVSERDESSGPDPVPSLVDETLLSIGFRKHSLFDAWCSYYESDQSVLAYRRPLGKGTQFQLAARDRAELNRVMIAVREHLHMCHVGST